MSRVFLHKPVLLKEVQKCFSYLGENNGAVFVDGTVGLGGHSLEIYKQIFHFIPPKTPKNNNPSNNFKIICIDKDQESLNMANKNFLKHKTNGLDRKKDNLKYISFVCDDFCNISKILINMKIKKVDGILLDLGVSSMQLDDKSRGFSFSDPNQSLDMRMNRMQHKDAEYILNNYPKHLLEKILRDGEEKFYKKIVKNIIEARKDKRIKKVGELLEIIANAYPTKLKMRQKSFATDTFRALRIEVNDEISRLAQSIETMVNLLNHKGRLAIISFHSLEDRIIKHKFRELENPCICPPKQPFCTCGKVAQIKIITKKPIIPSDDEIFQNPRARSAKLRVIEKI